MRRKERSAESGPIEYPPPGSAAERSRFHALQRRLVPQFRDVFPDPRAPRTIVVVPSLTADAEVLSHITGIHHYEERMLCMLMLLRLPRSHVVYVTSEPLSQLIIDYYLHLLPGIPRQHAMKRLTLLSCHDRGPAPLSAKILARPRLIERIREAIKEPRAAHMSCFVVAEPERTLAVRLGIPVYGCDPDLAALGSKSGSRQVFEEAGVAAPPGFRDLRDERDVVAALAALGREQPSLCRAVVKLNDGFAGEGNAVFSLDGAPGSRSIETWLRRELPRRLIFEGARESWERFAAKLREMGGVVEAWIDGEDKRSPSVQLRIDPLGHVGVISTHDQMLGGPSGQVFQGCCFPADLEYRKEIQAAGLRVGEVMKRRGVLGRFGVDFVSVRRPAGGFEHRALEINLRKGGTTHPFMMLQFLTDGTYDAEQAVYRTPAGLERCYYASDNLHDDRYRGLTPEDLIDLAVMHDLHFHGATQQGVVFHLIGALSQFGKLGILSVGDTLVRAQALYRQTVAILDRECGVPSAEAARPRLRRRSATRPATAP
jgi:hypothetical protein